ncbi:laminin subunit beta-4 [Brienomyrus brachyistius]|uniref:laminin subunit beta-4 n=1 Tax=Brienomyrus brachyistius TaxID=42636 RepID=UPI0020B21EEC|nr:laminin subunit beta-4 [Brienomyrus brachyistius]
MLHASGSLQVMPALTLLLRTLLHLLVLVASLHAQDDCSASPCHPQLGDLMVGRSGQLSASSTCGSRGPQNYCIIGYLEGEQKCFICDSRHPYNHFNNRNSHRIENVITTFEPKRKTRWWQSENGVDRVSIQLDLETLFQFSHLVLTFKSFRPAAMLVERSKDNGKTWKVFRYFAQDCASSFPDIPTEAAMTVSDVICESRYSGAEPSTGGEVVLKALDPNFQISNPHAPHIQELITMTNLRVNFTHLLTLGDTLLSRHRRNPQDKYYYALYEMVVRGSCFCNGHARECMPVDSSRGDVFQEAGMVHGRCVCQHNTAGENCERCQDFYNDAPWRPSDPHACRKCNCSGHSERCHFDAWQYLASRGLSGGVCDDCQNNRAGVHCELCRPFYYQDPRLPHDHPNACIPCDCEPTGSLDGGLCDPHTGRCVCKTNVEGERCDRCKYGFYGLSQDDPEGCQICPCDRLGSVLTPDPCHSVTGHCRCRPFATGPLCDRCMPGYWGLGNTVYACSPCDCDIGGALLAMCSPVNGQCQCRPNMVGRRCKDPAPGHFLPPLDVYLYEAEGAAPQQPSALSESTSLPTCEKYFTDQGYDFTFSNGRFILREKIRQKRQEQNSIPMEPGLEHQITPHEHMVDQPGTWTGQGFVHVQDGTELRFTVDNLPASLHYYLLIRYEPESTEDWKAGVKITASKSPSTGNCAHHHMEATLSLPGSQRVALLELALCLSDGGIYHVDITFQKQTKQAHHSSSHILVDSMGLIPKIESLRDTCSQSEWDTFQRYQCVEISSVVGPRVLPEVCKELIGSLSAWIHNGAVACSCDPLGSFNLACSKFGGQCSCKSNVTGRCCNSCTPLTFGLSPGGCSPCDCDPHGSLQEACDPLSGQCPCRQEVSGRRCQHCRPGYLGFPHCQPCQCHGLADSCDPVTGTCLDCRDHATGPSCDRCEQGYHGDPASGEPCQPCLCPDTIASGRFFARSCSRDPNALHAECDCHPGHSGPCCNTCSPGYYGNLTTPGARCVACHCNGNIDPRDVSSCDAVTGRCLRCLHNTHGSRCERCHPGYYGNALAQDCKACSCEPHGTKLGLCPAQGPCLCNPTSGECPCRLGVVGPRCDRCADGFWDLGGEAGCQPCNCDPENSISNQCDRVTGQCRCHPEFGGRRCNECADNFFGNPELQCIPCHCNLDGTEHPACNRYTGECMCKPGVTGSFCDECAVGHQASFPACPACHPCWSPWAQNVKDLRLEAERLSEFVRKHGAPGLPDYSAQMGKLQDDLDKITNWTRDVETIDIEKTEMLCQQISMLKDTIKPKAIIIDKTPLLNADIDDIRNDLSRQLEILSKKLKPVKLPSRKAVEEALREIKKHHDAVNDIGQQCEDAKAMLEMSRRRRQKVKEMLTSCSEKNLDSLERRVRNLNVADFNEAICGELGDAKCPQARCGGALCRDALGARRCGGPGCRGILSLSQNATTLGEQAKKLMADMPGKLMDSETKVSDTKQKSRNIKAKAEELKNKITEKKEKLEKNKNETMDLIQQVKRYLQDELVSPEDIEKVASAVLAIQLPLSPGEIQDMIDTIHSIMANSPTVREDLDHLTNQNRTVRELLEAAEDVQNKTRQINVRPIKRALKEAGGIQDKAKAHLGSASKDTDTADEQTQEMERKLDDIMKKLPDTKISDTLQQIETLRNKMEMNRLQAQEAKVAADTSLDSGMGAKTLLEEVKSSFEKLKKNEKKKDASDVVTERLKNITMEAEKLRDEIKDKTSRVEELEKRILDLEERKDRKVEEVAELMNEVAGIREEIAKKAAEYSSCT